MHKELPEGLEIYGIVGKDPEDNEWTIVGLSLLKDGQPMPLITTGKSMIEKLYLFVDETYKKEHNAQIVKFKQVDD